jgi:hypothetical protein
MSSLDPTMPRTVAAPRRPTFQRFFAWILAVVGALFVLLSLAVPSDEAETNKEGEVVVLVFGSVLLAGGALWLWGLRKRDRVQSSDFAERAILAVAARYGGRATIAQITLETPLSSAQAEEAINRLCGRNIAQPEIMDDGTVVYLFGMLGS